VVGIVGPNGCGKSNIVDAIRWVLGEQSASICAAARWKTYLQWFESRGPNGLAEVTLTSTTPIRSTRRAYPSSTATTRRSPVSRLYRDGTSEYLLNKTQVRLRDITELFWARASAPRPTRSSSSGRIGQIVSARPEDGACSWKRRRRHQVQATPQSRPNAKMELTRQNLLRINDIVSETRSLARLAQRQVAKAERFIEYRKELDDLVSHERFASLLELIVTERDGSDGFFRGKRACPGARSSSRLRRAARRAAKKPLPSKSALTKPRAVRSTPTTRSLACDCADLDRLATVYSTHKSVSTPSKPGSRSTRCAAMPAREQALSTRVASCRVRAAREADRSRNRTLSGYSEEASREEVHHSARQAGDLTARSAAPSRFWTHRRSLVEARVPTIVGRRARQADRECADAWRANRRSSHSVDSSLKQSA